MHSTDYYLLKNNIGVAELKGHRPMQEDCVSFGELNDFEKLSDAECKHVLLETVNDLVKRLMHQRFSVDQGSTLCVTVILNNKIYTVYLGDSAAFICILNKDKQVILFQQLNDVHHPDRPDERKRIEKKGGKITENWLDVPRINGQLALSRALGDRSLEMLGLSHKAEIALPFPYLANIPEGGKAFIINACDGLTENNLLSKNDIAMLIQQNNNVSPDIIALHLAENAYKKGVTDNISVLVTPIEPNSNQAKYLAIFDGHGGKEVSRFAEKLYYPLLTERIHTTLSQKK